MPYTESHTRPPLVLMGDAETKGELTYVLCKVIDDFMVRKGLENDGQLSFDHMGDVILALECAKLEFYRRVMVPHEDRKCEENGDVFDCLEFIP